MTWDELKRVAAAFVSIHDQIVASERHLGQNAVEINKEALIKSADATIWSVIGDPFWSAFKDYYAAGCTKVSYSLGDGCYEVSLEPKIAAQTADIVVEVESILESKECTFILFSRLAAMTMGGADLFKAIAASLPEIVGSEQEGNPWLLPMLTPRTHEGICEVYRYNEPFECLEHLMVGPGDKWPTQVFIYRPVNVA